ncbi:MAG: TVP38/TMEM64 family protein [Treponema sp.]|jgi:uncharacterized membrane protein YdjX (TVP38/TMEM64 family)|nr:TVP38/TMEM64 family protein [Treponema sp.]
MKLRQFFRRNASAGIVILFFLLLCAAGFAIFHGRTGLLRDPRKFRAFIEACNPYSELVFIGLQVLQVVVFIIPGEVFQIAAGYVFGAFRGTVYCLAGSIIGGTINFFAARFLFRHRVEHYALSHQGWIVEKIKAFENRSDYTGRAVQLVFLLYLIPGMPKDLLGYICGITEMAYLPYIIASHLGKLPALVVSTFFGGGIGRLPWYELAGIGAGVLLFVLICIAVSRRWIKQQDGTDSPTEES